MVKVLVFNEAFHRIIYMLWEKAEKTAFFLITKQQQPFGGEGKSNMAKPGAG